MNYYIKQFSELSREELYEILKIRAEIFVVEQNCAYLDIDGKDYLSYHIFLEDKKEIIAYLRVLPSGVIYDEVAIGRVLTKEIYRKKGFTRKLMNRAINFVRDILDEREIKISAQVYLQDFYRSLGFKIVSGVYLEDGIEHIEMLYTK